MDVLFWLSILSWPHRERSALVRQWFDSGRVHPTRARDPQAARHLLEDCARRGVEVLTPDRFPSGLAGLHDPPPVLFVRGDPTALQHPRRVAIIGARSGSRRGRQIADALGAVLAEAGVAVVSGLAEGVDGCSHQGCVRAGGRPIGVLGTGVDQVYPSHHRDLHAAVADAGCLVSELPPDEGPRRHRFLARNRLIAAIADALVVVEAGARSGTLSTTDFALQLGREVLAVPGPVDDPVCEGTNRLLREGATLIRGPQDLLDSLGLDPAVAQSADLSIPRTAEEIARAHGWTLPRTMAWLTERELEGRLQREPGGRYRWCDG